MQNKSKLQKTLLAFYKIRPVAKMVIEVSCCVACLSPVDQQFRLIKPGLVTIYKSILPVPVPEDLCIFFCQNCEANILHFEHFRSNCVNSLVNLVNIAGIKETYKVQDSKRAVLNHKIVFKPERGLKDVQWVDRKDSGNKNNKDSGNSGEEKVPPEIEILQLPSNESSQVSIPLIPEEMKQVPEPQTCVYCQTEFTSSESLKTHISEHLSSNKYECHFCSKQMSKVSLQRHLYSHIVDVPYRCKHCKKPSYTLSDHEKHMNYEIKKRERYRRTCELCGYVATRMSVLRVHMSSKHEGESNIPTTRIKCNKCGKILREKSYRGHMLTKHSTEVDKEKWVSCLQCSRRFHTNRALTVHVNTEHDVTVCEICNKTVGVGNLKKHIERVHPQLRKYECPILWCDQVFKIEITLVKHIYQHIAMRPYNCTLCSSGYYNTEYLKNHYAKTHNITHLKPEWLMYKFPDLSKVQDRFKESLTPQTKNCLDKLWKKCKA